MKTINLVIKPTILIIAFAFLFSCEVNDLVEPGNLVPLTVDENSSLPSITVNGTMLHAETFGDPGDPMIVAIHGGPGGDYRGILNCRDFANDGFFVVFYDQRGSGLSQRHEKSMYTTQLYIDDLEAVINHYQSPDQQLILVGHSWGAMLAAGYVNQNPSRVNAMILMEPGGLTWTDTEDYMARAMPLELFDESMNDAVYKDQFLTGSDHEILDYKQMLIMERDYAEGNKQGNPGPSPSWRHGAVCSIASHEYAQNHPFDFTTNLTQFESPVLFAYSELNEAYGREHAELVSAPFPNVELVEVKGSGHEIPYFGWDNFYPVAQSFLNPVK
jgi:proline iminopeptidase